MADTLLAFLEVILDGSPLSKAMSDDLVECSVENSLHLPDMCTVRLEDKDFVLLDSSQLAEGKSVVVKGGYEGSSMTELFNGEITALELDLSAIGTPTITIRCLNKMHRLHRGRFQRSFMNVKDEDLVSKIASELGFSVQTDTTSTVRDWVFQNNQTNWEFLQMLAARNGFRLYVSGERTLNFKKVMNDGSGVVDLKWAEEIRSYRPRTSATHQVDNVTVQGWDPKAKQPITAQATSATGVPQTSTGSLGGSIASSAYGSATMYIVDHPINSTDEASSMAQSVFDEIGASYLEADGLCYGRPDLLPGMQVNIKNIGQRFSGKYLLTATTHTYTPSEGLVTQISVSGKKPSGMVGGSSPFELANRARLGGNVVVGIVTNNTDPDDNARVKVKYPWLSDSDESFWARLVTPMAGNGRGFEYIPEVDDEVLVAFEHGDIHRPYILGGLWNGVDDPVEPSSKAVSGGKVMRRTIKSRIGHFMLFDDTDNKGEMSWTTCNSNRLALDDANQNITIKTTNGHTCVLDDQNQNITVKTTKGHTVLLDDQGSKIQIVDYTQQNSIEIDSNSGAISIQCFGDFSVNAQGQVTIQGLMGATVSTPAELELSGDAGATLESPAIVQINGSMVMINSG